MVTIADLIRPNGVSGDGFRSRRGRPMALSPAGFRVSGFRGTHIKEGRGR